MVKLIKIGSYQNSNAKKKESPSTYLPQRLRVWYASFALLSFVRHVWLPNIACPHISCPGSRGQKFYPLHPFRRQMGDGSIYLRRQAQHPCENSISPRAVPVGYPARLSPQWVWFYPQDNRLSMEDPNHWLVFVGILCRVLERSKKEKEERNWIKREDNVFKRP